MIESFVHLLLLQEYPFVLDAFQREALRCIENNQSVLVSAHTSAGKTVVAEYAIATSLRDTQRVIYTTPIKVKSNLSRARVCVKLHCIIGRLPVSADSLSLSLSLVQLTHFVILLTFTLFLLISIPLFLHYHIV